MERTTLHDRKAEIKRALAVIRENRGKHAPGRKRGFNEATTSQTTAIEKALGNFEACATCARLLITITHIIALRCKAGQSPMNLHASIADLSLADQANPSCPHRVPIEQ